MSKLKKRFKVDLHKVSSNVHKGECCPECGANWDGGDIYEYFLEAKFNPNHIQYSVYKEKSLDEIKKVAQNYGWSDDSPTRFGKVIGIQLSYDDPNYYDGISYWQCPNCEVAWNRFSYERTERFISDNSNCDSTNESDDGRLCVYRSLTTPDGTELVSYHSQHYVKHLDKNGEYYFLDGGTGSIYRTSTNNVPAKLTEVYLDEGHEKIRNYVHRGGRGIDGKQPLTWVPVAKMSDAWLEATIVYNEERGLDGGWFSKVLEDEVNYRLEHNIKVKE